MANSKKVTPAISSRATASKLPRQEEVEHQVAAPANDEVNSPVHYTIGGIEVIDVLRAKLSREQFRGYCLGSMFAYGFRADHKGHANKDLRKARVYLDWLIDATP